MSDLLPCPFCGGEATLYRFVESGLSCSCDDCDASTTGCGTDAEAAAAWNRRALPAVQSQVAVKRGGNWIVIGNEAWPLSDLVDTTFDLVENAGSDNPGFDLPHWFFTGSPFSEQIRALGVASQPVPHNFVAETVPDLGQVWRNRRPLWECYTTGAARNPTPDPVAAAAGVLLNAPRNSDGSHVLPDHMLAALRALASKPEGCDGLV